MPDITMCSGGDCSKKEQCYRYKAIPNEQWQYWFVAPPIHTDDVCSMFWEMNNDEH